ncbi:LytR cell envelope-related transcriptional attenuator [Amycolatopsis xylanica]|uniref:LytR cell envelope-related transcriptional attenuator n=1 Tax=Amycolatopsis xylanica TaxID=589385 RepID=A0A1H3IWZ0_9PSEU|nr:envelope integrity protein Cei [Amycolatopsis xylanica]SDY32087.1 LytR cell envelope-related transcriptional attenuator [Amycolatopsis xylanica]
MASGNGFGDRGTRPYRKRRPLPALIVIGVLFVGAMIVWVNAMLSKADIDEAIKCTPAPIAAEGVTYTPLGHAALDDRSPIPPDKISLRVLNASGVRGQGKITDTTLRELGFTGITETTNDPAYPEKTPAKCKGQIRFGENGVTAARTVSLIAPCAELVKDNRADASVDLAIGTKFGDIQPKAEASKIIEQLKTWSAQHQGGGGGEQSAGAPSPNIDQTLLASARDVTC